MELYLMKSAACLAIFFVFYKVFLERENIHTFKRYYLLGSLIAAFLIPLITFTHYVPATPMDTLVYNAFEVNPSASQIAASNEGLNVSVLPTLLSVIYFIGVLFFSIKFTRNLTQIIQKIRRNPLYRNANIFHVLLNSPTTPHTFFNYIFLNKERFEADEIPAEVLLHEQTHAIEKHSIDILLIELLQIVLWFHPFIYAFKKSIKLNHEFLADRGVLNQGIEPTAYQKILLAFSSKASTPVLANSINYSSIKKRFTVMKTQSSRSAILLRTLILLPLLAVMVYSFSSTDVIEKKAEITSEVNPEKATPQEVATYNKLAAHWNAKFSKTNAKRSIDLTDLQTLETLYRKMSSSQKEGAEPFPNCVLDTDKMDAIPTARSIDIQIEANGTYMVEGIRATKNTLTKTVERLHQDLTPAIRNHMMNIHITHPKDPSREEVQFIFDALKEYGFYRLVAGNQEVVRGKGNTPFKSGSLGALENKTNWKTEYANKYNEGAKRNGKLSIVIMVTVSEIMVNGKTISLKNFAKEVDLATKDWTKADFNLAHPSVLVASTPKVFLEKVDAEFRKTNYYKANNGMSIIPIAAPTPPESVSEKEHFSEVIPAVRKKYDANLKATPKQIAEYNKLAKKYNRIAKDNLFIVKKEIDRMNHLYGLMTEEQRANAEPYPNLPPPPPPPLPDAPDVPDAPKNKWVSDDGNPPPPPPPPPPAPEAPLDHLISMAKKGASFFYEDIPISSDKAIDLIKKKPDLNIQTTGFKSNKPIVKISKKPITFEH